MPKTNQPYDPQPERTDAFGELAREGYQAVAGDHSARLQSIQDRLGLPTDTAPATDAAVRTMRPRRWLAIAAGIAAFVAAGIALYNYDSPEPQMAKVMSPVEDIIIEDESADIAEAASEKKAKQELPAPAAYEAKKDVETNRLSSTGVITQPTLGDQQDVAPTSRSTSTSDVATTQALPKAQKRKAVTAKAQAEIAADQLEEAASQPPIVSGPEAEAPPSANSLDNNKRATEQDVDMLTEDAAEATTSERAKDYRMERAPTVKTRQVSGEVVEPSGSPVIGATITIEETGQQVVTDLKGEFKILVTDEAVVGEIKAEGYSPFLLDVTLGEEYRIFLPRVASSLPTAQLKGKDVGLRMVAPKAEVNPTFDEYIATKQSEFSGEKVVVQFDVNRSGRPRQIMSGPGKQNRDAVKEIKEWLKSGPDWPEAYQRKSWRYVITLP